MKVLLDNNMPDELTGLLAEHLVVTTRAKGWDLLRNGHLLKAAEAEGFQSFITGDKKMVRQYTKLVHRISIIIVGNPHRGVLRANIDKLRAAFNRTSEGSVEAVDIPGTIDFYKQQEMQEK